MKLNTAKTFSLLYLPFLAISLISTAVYSLLNYFVLQHIHLFSDSIANIFLPIVFVFLSFLIFYKEKVKLIPAFSKDLMRAYYVIIIVAVPGPTIFQSAIEHLSIRHHDKANVDDIELSSGVHQYELNGPSHYDTAYLGVKPRYYTSYNKNSPDDSHHQAFIVSLVYSSSGQRPVFWFGKKYEHVVRKDRSEESQKQFVYDSTIRSSIDDFMRSSVDSLINLEMNLSNDDYQYFQAAVSDAPEIGYKDLPILTEIQKRDSVSFVIKAAVIVFVIGQVIWAIICMFIKVHATSLADQAGLSTAEKFRMRGKEFRESISWFAPRKGYFATPIILDINIITYLLLGMLGVSMMNPSGADLIPYGSGYSPLVMEGQVWRLFTSGFLHFGFIHILMNMLALGFCGYMLEHVLGTRRFIILYVVSLLGGSLVSLFWNHPANSAGASGAIFGLLGAMLFYALFNIGDRENRMMFILVFVFFGLFTLITDLIAWSHSDMAGHLGGMVTGIVVAIFFIPAVRKAGEIKID